MSRGLSHAESERVADLATPEELQRFYEWDAGQKVAIILGELDAADEIARQARKLARQILRRNAQ